MCGLAGFWTSNKLSDSRNVLDEMLNNIEHRGKDNRGIEIIEKDNGQVGVGHNRLSIIDLTQGANQPFKFEHLVLAFNGEIYNYKELQELLYDNGYQLDTNSDTEVIIKLYHLMGRSCFNLMNGMFSIYICDQKSGQLILARDRMGVKPMYYYQDENSFLVASELKAFYSFPNFSTNLKWNNKQIASYFKYGFVNSFDSVFEGVEKTQNGHVLTFDISTQQVNSEPYWELNRTSGTQLEDYNEALDSMYNILKSSINYRLVSDVPVGLFLSSGLDSNLVLNLSLDAGLKSIDTYTLRCVDYDETDLLYDSRVNRKFVESSKEEIWDDFKFLCSQYDEPFSDPATIGLYQLSKAGSAYNKVIMVGDGGDEILAGYAPYKVYARFNAKDNLKIRLLRSLYSMIRPVMSSYLSATVENDLSKRLVYYHSLFAAKNTMGIAYNAEECYNSFTNKIVGTQVRSNVMDFDKGHDLLDFLNYKTSTELVHQLNYKTDIAGMLNTLEIREPFLDYRLFELQQSFSQKLLADMVAHPYSKQLFRSVFSEKLGLDVNQLQKKGFHIKLEHSINDNRSEIDAVLNNYSSTNIDMIYGRALWDRYKKGKTHFMFINRLLSYVYWEQKVTSELQHK